MIAKGTSSTSRHSCPSSPSTAGGCWRQTRSRDDRRTVGWRQGRPHGLPGPRDVHCVGDVARVPGDLEGPPGRSRDHRNPRPRIDVSRQMRQTAGYRVRLHFMPGTARIADFARPIDRQVALLGSAINPVMSIRDGGSLARLPGLKTSPACAWLRGQSAATSRPAGGRGIGRLRSGIHRPARPGDLGRITVACRLLWCGSGLVAAVGLEGGGWWGMWLARLAGDGPGAGRPQRLRRRRRPARRTGWRPAGAEPPAAGGASRKPLVKARVPSPSRRHAARLCSLPGSSSLQHFMSRPAWRCQLGSDGGSPNQARVLASKLVMAQIRSPVRVSTYRPVPRRTPLGAAR